MRSKHGQYVGTIALVAVSFSIVVAGVNWLVDPYGLFSPPVEFRLIRPEVLNHERTLKAFRVTEVRPEGIILGASTSAGGLSPRHPDWRGERVYNLALGGGNITSAYRFLLHTAEFQMPQQVVLGVELAMFNPELQRMVGLTPDALATTSDGQPNPEYATRKFYGKLLSRPMFVSSLRSGWASLTDKSPRALTEHVIDDLGLMRADKIRVNIWSGWRDHFQQRVKEHVERFWAPVDRFRSTEDLYASNAMEAYRGIIRFACENDIDLQIVISPMHAYMMEATRYAGLWPVWEQWMEGLVRAADAEARADGCEPFPVWDFSGYSKITTEQIAATTDPADEPSGYWDAAHYKLEIGDIVLQTVFSGKVAREGFGVRLDSENIRQHLREMARAANEYAVAHPEEVKLVHTTVDRVIEADASR